MCRMWEAMMKQKPIWSARVSCWPAQWNPKRIPVFQASETSANGVVLVASKWVGGDKRPIHNSTFHPVDVRQGVC